MRTEAAIPDTRVRSLGPPARDAVGQVYRELMAREAADLPPERVALVATEADEGDTERLSLDEWLVALAEDEPVVLPKPAAAYLDEARAAGEA